MHRHKYRKKLHNFITLDFSIGFKWHRNKAITGQCSVGLSINFTVVDKSIDYSVSDVSDRVFTK